MAAWRFILITMVLMKTKDPRLINAEVSRDNFARYYNEPVEIEKRLPADVLPRKYVIAIRPDLEKDEFHGTVRIDIELTKDRSYIVLHSKDLVVSSVKLYAEKSRTEVRIRSVQLVEKREMLIIEPRGNLSVGEYRVKMNFAGSLKGKMSGFYLSTYADHDKSVKKLAVSQFEPLYARTAFPCFDEPGFKSIFLVRIAYTRKHSYRALSNMPVAKTESMKNDRDKRIAYFDATPPMSTYLVAFLVSDFDCLGSTLERLNGGEIPLSICTRPRFKDKARFALRVAVASMRYYLRTFRIDYPLPKLDLLAVPDFTAGAMENWGLVTFRETELLHTGNDSSCTNTRSVSLTVAHELAHMWFGNLVTMKWWNDLWLNEGFATYMEHVAVDSLFPEWNLMDSFPLHTKYVAMKQDCKLRARPVIKRIEDPDEIEEMFDRISYQKAAAVIRMLEDAVGNSKFTLAITDYLQRYKFKNAESRDLFEILGNNNTHGIIDIADFMDRWTRFPGFPVINVDRGKNGFRLSQRRFAISARFQQSIDDGSWTIPIRYVTSRRDGVKLDWFLANFSCVELSLERSVNWVKLNHNSVGYYITNYTEDDWSIFVDLLSRDHRALSAADRADLLHDAVLLAESNFDYAIVMNLTSYLVNEEDYQPWAIAAAWFGEMNRLLAGTRAFASFQLYARSLVDEIYRQVGWQVHAGHSFKERESRVLILNAACTVGHEHCLERAGRKLRNFLLESKNGGARTLSADIRSIVYSFGSAAPSDDAETIYKELSRLLVEQTDVQERERLMIGLASIRDKDILNRYLQRATDETFIRKQDFADALMKVAANPVGLDVAWNFVRSRWDGLLMKYRGNEHSLGKIVCALLSLFKDREKLQQVRNFLEKQPDLKVTENAKRNTIEEIENSIDWLQTNFPAIETWLLDRGF